MYDAAGQVFWLTPPGHHLPTSFDGRSGIVVAGYWSLQLRGQLRIQRLDERVHRIPY